MWHVTFSNIHAGKEDLACRALTVSPGLKELALEAVESKNYPCRTSVEAGCEWYDAVTILSEIVKLKKCSMRSREEHWIQLGNKLEQVLRLQQHSVCLPTSSLCQH